MANKLTTVDCLGYKIFSGELNHISVKSRQLINTINQYSYCIAEQNPLFKESLLNSDILLPDGVGITAAVKMTTGRKIKKIAGADIHQHLLKSLNKTGGKCFYMGSSPVTLEKIKSRLKEEYPNVEVETYSPPYKPEFTKQDNQKIINAVNSYQPDVLFVGMTAPKQEQWSYLHKSELNTNIICSIGAVFDFYAGTVERPGKVWISLGLEWFARLLKEPKRMSKRYLYYGPIYAGMLLKAKVKSVVA